MRAAAVVGALLAATGVVATLTVFAPCGGGAGLAAAFPSMHCAQSGHAVVFALSVAAAAWLLAALQPRGRRLLVGAIAAAGVVTVGAVAVWPGVCGAPTMPCVIGTRPAAIVFGALQLIVAAAAGLALGRARRAATGP
ncbi:MAG TPA: DUF4418 family protein [Polyangia bacterium]|jgi:hypothetical protein